MSNFLLTYHPVPISQIAAHRMAKIVRWSDFGQERHHPLCATINHGFKIGNAVCSKAVPLVPLLLVAPIYCPVQIGEIQAAYNARQALIRIQQSVQFGNRLLDSLRKRYPEKVNNDLKILG